MKKLFLLQLLAVFMLFPAVLNAGSKSKADKQTIAWRYDIEAMGVGTQGTYLIKVWSYSKKSEVAIEQARKNAVHGIIFRGFAGKQGIPGQRPLTNNPNLEQEQMEFFEAFFADGGKYMKFVSSSADGSIPVTDRMKVGKEYKVAVVISVNVAELRKDLEAAGIIKGLSSGF